MRLADEELQWRLVRVLGELAEAARQRYLIAA
jgi:hypothetical protein